MTTSWQPGTTQATLKARARLNSQIRQFFAEREVLEVETPLLSTAIGTDPQLSPVTAAYQPAPHQPAQPLFLQTSPEFAMKRLLAANSGPVYQLGKAFRNGEASRRHNPEFTMLEWYRPGFSLEDLMTEVSELIEVVLGITTIPRISYRDLFVSRLSFDPHTITLANVAKLAGELTSIATPLETVDQYLDLLFAMVIEPELQDGAFIYHYPASQAALARITEDENGMPVARRFELVIAGLELANGYDELLDADEQLQRFKADQQTRVAANLPQHPIDQNLLAALAAGMPQCAGVAIGVDRLLMLLTGAKDIQSVLTFAFDRI